MGERSLTPVGISIFYMLMGTALLSLRNEFRTSLVPYASQIAFVLQSVVGMLGLLLVRLKTSHVHDRCFTIFGLFVSLFFWAVATAFWSDHSYLVLQRAFLVFVPLLILFPLVWSDSRPIITFRHVSLFLVVLVCGLVLVGVVLYFFGVESFDKGFRVQRIAIGRVVIAQNVMGHPPLLRMSSFLGNPNALASWVLLALPPALYLLSSHVVPRIAGLAMISVLSLGLVLTFSRAGWGATLVALVVYALFSNLSKRKRLRTLLIIGVAVVLIIFLVTLYTDVGGRRFSLDLNSRGQLWGILAESLKDTGVFGVGFGVSSESVLQRADVESAGHNMHLIMLAESGLIGYGLFVVICVLSLLFLAKRRRGRSTEQLYALAAVAAVQSSLLLHQVFEGSLMRYGFITLFWGFIVAFGLHPALVSTTLEARTSQPRVIRGEI